MRVLAAWGLGLVMVLSFGCSRIGQLNSRKAIQGAIEAHLKQRSDLMRANFNMELQTVRVTEDQAEAEIKYSSKQSSNVYVRVRYLLRKTGGHWEVISSKAIEGMPSSPVPPTSPVQNSSPEAINPVANH